MKLIFGQPVDKMAVKSPIVFGSIKSHGCPVGGRGILGVMLDFDPIQMKFGMCVEFDELNDFPKFGYNQFISCLVRARTKNSANPLPLSLIHISEPTRPY